MVDRVNQWRGAGRSARQAADRTPPAVLFTSPQSIASRCREAWHRCSRTAAAERGLRSPRGGVGGCPCVPRDLRKSMLNYQIAQRAQIGVIIPSTNTGVEYDLQKFAVQGVTWHPSRFWVELPEWMQRVDETGAPVDDVFEACLEKIATQIPSAIRNALSAKVQHLMIGMNAENIWGGLEGERRFEAGIREQIGPDVGLTTSARACREALNRFGAKRISMITPYPPVGDQNVTRFFSDIGFEVKATKGLCRPSATEIATTTTQQVLDIVREVDGDDVDAIVQVGTNLSTSDIFPVLEHTLGKPCIPNNLATIWQAYRDCGIDDKVYGKGRLFEEF